MPAISSIPPCAQGTWIDRQVIEAQVRRADRMSLHFGADADSGVEDLALDAFQRARVFRLDEIAVSLADDNFGGMAVMGMMDPSVDEITILPKHDDREAVDRRLEGRGDEVRPRALPDACSTGSLWRPRSASRPRQPPTSARVPLRAPGAVAASLRWCQRSPYSPATRPYRPPGAPSSTLRWRARTLDQNANRGQRACAVRPRCPGRPRRRVQPERRPDRSDATGEGVLAALQQ